MQFDFWPYEQTLFIEQVHGRLLKHFGSPGPWFHPDPVSQLVLGLIGGRTYGAVSLAAYMRLVERFPSWEAVRDGKQEDIHEVIFRVTFADVKAPRLQAALRSVTEQRGRLDLDFLAERKVADAMEWLMHLPGVGPKVAAVTLNFSTLRMPALVVDTHHLRVLRRLRIVREKAGLAEAYGVAMSRMPAGWSAAAMDEHHQLMKQLGQSSCRHRNPECGNCPLRDLCRSGDQQDKRLVSPRA